MNNSHFAIFAQHSADQLALSYLEDVWIARNPVEHRYVGRILEDRS
jgi:template-activating factor I